jgi:hypothetical protein
MNLFSNAESILLQPNQQSFGTIPRISVFELSEADEIGCQITEYISQKPLRKLYIFKQQILCSADFNYDYA